MPISNDERRTRYQENEEYRERTLKQQRESYHRRKTNQTFKEKRQQWRKISQERLKLSVLSVYGGKPPKCSCCGEVHLEFLTIDHILGYRGRDGSYSDGTPKYRSGTALYQYLRVNNYPLGYRVLCLNCNFAIGHFGYCPHQNKGS
jgi:hypothetical protein